MTNVCDQCGAYTKYCIECQTYHHLDSFQIDHKEFQEDNIV